MATKQVAVPMQSKRGNVSAPVGVEVEVVNCATAKAYLDKNVVYERGEKNTNRPISLHYVNVYARDMLRGNWRFTHQGLAFDSNGDLKDGQHRLMALVQAAEEGAIDGDEVLDPQPDIAIPFLVTRGLLPEVFSVLDTGMNRNAGSILAMSGYSNTMHLAAAGRLLYLYDNLEYRYWAKNKVSNQQVLDTVKENGLDEFISVGMSTIQIGLIASACTIGYYICQRSWPEGPHMQFIEDLRNGVGLAADSPALVLRNYMIRSRNTDRVRRDSFQHLAMYVKSWNDYAMGRRRHNISWRTNESFPIPYEGPNSKDSK